MAFAKANGAVQTSVNAVSNKADTNSQRVDFFSQFGWNVANEPCEIVEVLIPDEFNAVYEKYNAIQKEAGFDLSKYKGKRVKRYTYTVTNYEGYPDEVIANLLVYNKKAIGGDICSVRLDGFMHSFIKK
ncbi:hypothetical protein SDC9_191312 [bioreactor metagenome]|uniref:DUF4830 domain-containing protein n=1 Tax=bioreactor metagenome TaxID=1076179 RepID=A0A645HZ39_9ZZZZ